MKFLKSAIVILLACFLFGCGAGNADFGNIRWATLPIGIAAQSEDDFEVMELYNEIFGIEMFVYDEDGVQISLAEDLGQCVKGTVEIESDDYGDAYSASINMLDGMYDDYYKIVLAHQLGHVLGANHSQNCIMREKVYSEESLDSQLDCQDFIDTIENLYPEYFDLED